jgi:hypothetical protein
MANVAGGMPESANVPCAGNWGIQTIMCYVAAKLKFEE